MNRVNMLESLSENIIIDKDKCTSCGICVDTCILDNLRLQLSPCRQACPLGVNCQGYVQLIARGEEAKALELLRETLPFPGILGRICSQPCEDGCHHKNTDGKSVAIRALKRYLADEFDSNPALPEIAPDTDRSVAVIGSGPAGLMAAYDLRSRGHAVTIYESASEAGGMLRWAIPEFRLPTAVVEREIDLLRRMGVTFRLETAIGSDLEMNAVKASHQAVIVATGCPRHLQLENSGESLAGIVHGLPFLKSVRYGQRPAVGRQVVVIGGGNVAVDAAQTALRLGAEQVTMVCLEAEHEVPAHPDAMAQAKAEGIRLECSWGSVEFLSQDDKLNGVVFQRCVQVFDDRNCFCPQFDACELNQIDCDMVIVAIGQTADQQALDQMGLVADITAGVDPLTLQTSDPMVFMAGDVLSGASSVIEAMAKGRQAAESAHRYLSAEHLRHGRAYAGPFETGFEINTDHGNGAERARIPHAALSGVGDFDEIEQCFDQATARKEAGRCYNCGVPFGKYRTCWFCLPCEVECPHTAMWVEIPYLLR